MTDFKTLPDIKGEFGGAGTSPGPEDLRRLLDHDSMKVYYTVGLSDDGYTLTELPTTAARAEIIRPIFDKLITDYGLEASVIDLACSPGYFMFKLASMGYRHIDGVDAREDHRDQFNLLNSHYRMDGITFHLSDMYRFLDEQIAAGRKYDICMLYGFLYHTSTPVELLDKIRRICGRCLVIDTTLSFRDDVSLNVYEEPVQWSRASTSKISMNPSLRTVPLLVEAAGFSRCERFIPDQSMKTHNPGGDNIDYYFDLPRKSRKRVFVEKAANRLINRKVKVSSRRALFVAYV